MPAVSGFWMISSCEKETELLKTVKRKMNEIFFMGSYSFYYIISNFAENWFDKTRSDCRSLT
jgi:hypothetical protein